jgi:hypothetical protein
VGEYVCVRCGVVVVLFLCLVHVGFVKTLFRRTAKQLIIININALLVNEIRAILAHLLSNNSVRCCA